MWLYPSPTKPWRCPLWSLGALLRLTTYTIDNHVFCDGVNSDKVNDAMHVRIKTIT